VDGTGTIDEKRARVVLLVITQLGLYDIAFRPGDLFNNIPGETHQFERIDRDGLMGFTAVGTALAAR
jgi:hypothetical protein